MLSLLAVLSHCNSTQGQHDTSLAMHATALLTFQHTSKLLSVTLVNNLFLVARCSAPSIHIISTHLDSGQTEIEFNCHMASMLLFYLY